MGDPEHRAGAGPYREGRLTPPARPSAPAVATGLGGGAVALVTVARLLIGRTAAPPAAPPSPYIERATSLAGGARVTAVFFDGSTRRAGVLRVPGEPRREGDDVRVAPEVLPGNGAVAALPDGVHLRDRRGEFMRVRDGAVRNVPIAEAALPPGFAYGLRDPRFVERAGDFARVGDGPVVFLHGGSPMWANVPDERLAASALATDGANVCAALETGQVRCAATSSRHMVGGPNAPFVGYVFDWRRAMTIDPRAVEQLAVSGDVVCARTTGGAVRCAAHGLAYGGAFGDEYAPLPFDGGPPRATAVALGDDDLCLLAPDRKLHCVHGPAEDATAPLAKTPLRFHVAMEGVDEVGLADGVGCARRGGRVECWGRLARGGWVARRDRAVRMEGLSGMTALRRHRGYVCAVAGEAAWCWGVGGGARLAVPTRVDVPRVAWDVAGAVDGDECRGTTQVAGARAGESITNGGLSCVVGPDGGVSCGDAPEERSSRGEVTLTPVPGLTEVVEVMIGGDGLACALRRDGGVWCWGDNASGALTAAEAERGPRVVTMTR